MPHRRNFCPPPPLFSLSTKLKTCFGGYGAVLKPRACKAQYLATRCAAKNKGFTLIELLVVVLIIGILASVALPKYTKAVERSRATQILLLLKAISTTQQEYKLATGDYAPNFEELGIEVPGFTLNPYKEPDRILWSEDVMIAMEPLSDGSLLLRGMPRRGCQIGNSIALENNQCYVFDISTETGKIVCSNGSKSPVKMRCKDIGY